MTLFSLIALSFAPAHAQAVPSVTASQSVLQVGESTTVELTFTVGSVPLVTGDSIKVYDPEFHGVSWPWSALSLYASDCIDGSVGQVTVSSDATALLGLMRNSSASVMHKSYVSVVTVNGGFVMPGETITLTLGDTSTSSDCTWTAGPRTFDNITFDIMADMSLFGAIVDLNSPTLAFESLGTVEEVVVSARSEAVVDEPFTLRVAMLDAYGNPVEASGHVVRLRADKNVLWDSAVHPFTASDDGVWTTQVTPRQLGVLRVTVTDVTSGLDWESNPILVESSAAAPAIFWGDLHVHHGHSWTESDGTLVDQNHDYGRDVLGLQFGCESMKAADTEIDPDSLWEHQKQVCTDYSVDDEYIALLGFEWMGDQSDGEGHHNVYYDGCEGPLGTDMPSLSDPTDGLYVFQLETEADYGTQSVAIPHATSSTGFNWDDQDNSLRTLVEVYSQGWGFSDAVNVRGSGVYDGLGLGLRLGMLASSDNHLGWMGNRLAPNEPFASPGLAALVATDLSRQSLFEAMQTRSSYATTGQRSILRFKAQDGAETIAMGEEYVATSPLFNWHYYGVAMIDSVKLMGATIDASGGYTIAMIKRWTPGSRDGMGQHIMSWDGSEMAVWLHVVEASGEESWSSPIWLLP